MKKLKNFISELSVVFSTGLVLSSFYIEYYLKILPCDLCLKQRYVHFVLIFVGIITAFLKTRYNKGILIEQLIILIWLLSAMLAFYHYGIESDFWLPIKECSSSITLDSNALKNILSQGYTSCKNVKLTFFSLSLSGWNSLISFYCFLMTLNFYYFSRN